MIKKLISASTTAVILLIPLVGRAGVNDIFKGWGWNSVNSGWISLNSTNTGAGVDYGITIDSGKNVLGWAWSATLGWICFGPTCAGNPPGVPASSWAIFDDSVNPPQIRGWARVHSLYTLNPAGEEGWISLNCSNLASCGTSNYYVYASLLDGYFRGYAWNGSSVAGSYSGGAGWIRFDPVYTPPPGDPYEGAQGGVPWLQVLYGDLYTKGNLSTPSPFTGIFQTANATYCLDKGPTSVVTNFQGGNCPFPLTTNLNLPTSRTGYATSLGRIDLAGLAAGKYGPHSFVTQATLDAAPYAEVPGGMVRETSSTGTFTLSAHQINNASGTGSGAGLFIVHGNLNITGDIVYQIGVITRLKQLASFGILVLDDGSGTKGNVTIAPNVGTVSANIYAEGTVSTGTYPDQQANPDIPLVVNGVVVARQILFQRQFSGSVNEPAERIVYDGRIVANTPPGMNDFAQSLPTISN